MENMFSAGLQVLQVGFVAGIFFKLGGYKATIDMLIVRVAQIEAALRTTLDENKDYKLIAKLNRVAGRIN